MRKEAFDVSVPGVFDAAGAAPGFWEPLFGAVMLAAAFSFLRLALWAVLSVWAPRLAGALSSLLAYAAAVFVAAYPELRWAVFSAGCRAAQGIFGGLLDRELAGGLLLEIDRVLSEVQGLVR